MTTSATHAAASPVLAAAAVTRPWATYERISKRRSGDGVGGSVGEDRQHADNVAYIRALDPTAEIVDFRDNMSAWSPDVVRPDWERLLAGVRAGNFRGVVGWHADRYTRQPLQLEHLIMACKVGGTQLHTTHAGHHKDPTLIRIESALAAADSDGKSMKITSKHAEIAAQGKPHGGRRAYGYTAKRDAVVEAEAAHIRWAAQQVLKGRSMRSIVADLTERGAVTVSGSPWRAGNLGTYLRRPMLAGLRTHRGAIMEAPATWPAILDMGTWDAVRTLLENPERRISKRSARVYLLSGIATCGGCGGPMRGRSNESSALPAAYQCGGEHVTGCAYRRADLVDAQVRAAVVARLAQVDAYGALVVPSDPSEAQALAQAIADLEERQDALVGMQVRGQITERQLTVGTAAAERELASLRDQQSLLAVDDRRPSAVLEGLAGMADAADLYDAMDLERRRAVVKELCTVVIQPTASRAVRRDYDPALVQVTMR